MKTIHFTNHPHGAYGCSEPGDNAGEYVRADVAGAAMRFVPKPEDMAGFDDDDAPPEVREMIELAKWLHSEQSA